LKKAFGFIVAAVLPFMIAGALLTSRGVTASVPDQSIRPMSESPAQSPEFDLDDDDEAIPVDLMGNPVADAVAKYKFDAMGSLYELHSPQTELPRLGSPKS
jgi:hypothetical protein